MEKFKTKVEVISYLENVAEYSLLPQLKGADDPRKLDVATANYELMSEVIDWIDKNNN